MIPLIHLSHPTIIVLPPGAFGCNFVCADWAIILNVFDFHVEGYRWIPSPFFLSMVLELCPHERSAFLVVSLGHVLQDSERSTSVKYKRHRCVEVGLWPRTILYVYEHLHPAIMHPLLEDVTNNARGLPNGRRWRFLEWRRPKKKRQELLRLC